MAPSRDFLIMLARQHAVDGIERHAQEERNRQQQQPQPLHRRKGDEETVPDAHEHGRDRHLIGGDAGARRASA